ncbi:bifunctional adenosylcobinamide kinase/adenosylcobinamide-phosphate guanylyltransferase [Jeongeupia sp. USM3]|uniref:bifunctional adenosylcobinamide kinase/adenosylcobinamide-phosphate guanylyltransferase n=1 Tax=Jeongeupia sp. USM3 TaxID=1906741 RepID=UPI00089DE811|nr:bifunctional adenosylcobinamide kinase/adenosylcobinamide-phosphate guanylyltransferase [Jeongeupia sp. USM3]AOY00772.1 bifunctional adenosylcobinamide kinase/adenosylcobinamide-phosphate guanylyltransferase [Jeongeupia sp. USM3]
MATTLILGGARSGKSALAERLALASGRDIAVIVTATRHPGDAEMAARIAHHRARRPAGWTTVEAPLALADAIRREATPGRLVLVDCLTVWLANLLFSDGAEHPETGVIALPARLAVERDALLAALAEVPGDVVLVANEVGLGIVPLGAINRAFVDEAGRLNQAVAALCDNAAFVAAGLPLMLKGALPPA